MGYASDTARFRDSTTGLDVTTTSAGLGFDVLDFAIGGTVASGLVLAYGAHLLIVPSPNTVQRGEHFGEHGAIYEAAGLVVDYYPDDRGGLYVTATVGVGIADFVDRGTEYIGFGGAVAGASATTLGSANSGALAPQRESSTSAGQPTSTVSTARSSPC
jgi:hypothetical protein